MTNEWDTIDERVFHDLTSIIEEWKKDANYNYPVLIARYYNSSLTLCTAYPGRLIGFKGEMVNKYLSKLHELPKYENICYINWVETMNLVV